MDNFRKLFVAIDFSPWTYGVPAYGGEISSRGSSGSNLSLLALSADNCYSRCSIRRSRAAIERGNFHPVAADFHAAPVTTMILRRVIKVQNTGRIFALFDHGKVAIAEQVSCRLR